MAQKEQDLSKIEIIFGKEGLNLLRFKIPYSFSRCKCFDSVLRGGRIEFPLRGFILTRVNAVSPLNFHWSSIPSGCKEEKNNPLMNNAIDLGVIPSY